MKSFQLARLPELSFGEGAALQAIPIARQIGKKILLLRGGYSIQGSTSYRELLKGFDLAGLDVKEAIVPTEPSPELINELVKKFRPFSPELVIGLGGGSVLDAGKAVSAMLPSGKDVRVFLEGIGSETHNGIKIPYMAIPTTAGTGSEASKNAVISEIGANGFKRSLRHDKLVPDYALVDPLLTLTCPEIVTVSSGLDALTQLMEAYLSTRAGIFTDSLSLPAIASILEALPILVREPYNLKARSELSYASYISGVCLANAGLGVVHGFASVIGSLVLIPHGTVCGILMAACHPASYKRVLETDEGSAILRKYNKLGALLSAANGRPETDLFSNALSDWMKQFQLPGLSSYGIHAEMLNQIIEKTEQKNNPVKHSKDELWAILNSCL